MIASASSSPRESAMLLECRHAVSDAEISSPPGSELFASFLK